MFGVKADFPVLNMIFKCKSFTKSNTAVLRFCHCQSSSVNVSRQKHSRLTCAGRSCVNLLFVVATLRRRSRHVFPGFRTVIKSSGLLFRPPQPFTLLHHNHYSDTAWGFSGFSEIQATGRRLSPLSVDEFHLHIVLVLTSQFHEPTFIPPQTAAEVWKKKRKKEKKILENWILICRGLVSKKQSSEH